MGTILTFDIGTTAIKTCLFDETLKLLKKRTDEYNLTDEDGLIELESEVYWETICHAVSTIGDGELLKTVEAICLTTQGETLIPVDRKGTPLHRAIVWLDNRAESQSEEIRKRIPREEVYRLTGVTDINGFVPLAKLLWFKEKRPEIYKNTYKFLLLEDFLLYRLTGRFVTEKSLLTSTGYYDIRHDCYWEELLDMIGLEAEKLPKILDCGQQAGALHKRAAMELGLSEDAKVFAGAMDQIAAAIGGGGMREGVVTATIGTALVLTSAIPSMDDCSDSSLILYRGIKEGQYAILPLCSTAGAVFKWFKDQFCQWEIEECGREGTDIYDKLCAYAKEVPAGAKGVLLLPYFAGSFQPLYIPEAKGVFFGLGVTSDKKVLVRAVLESIGYMLRENLEMLRKFGISIKRLHFFGGGSKNMIWNQIIADIADVELALPEQEECASFGAAVLGAVSMGWYESVEEAQDCNSVRRIVRPDPLKKDIYDKIYARYKKLLNSVMPIFEEIKGEDG
ncbi:MAG: hypothetical protein HFI28_09610 [Lachnospiraceae bacterium]|nr:hypothetical protein [Lachnospiraceae bacterium]